VAGADREQPRGDPDRGREGEQGERSETKSEGSVSALRPRVRGNRDRMAIRGSDALEGERMAAVRTGRGVGWSRSGAGGTEHRRSGSRQRLRAAGGLPPSGG